jgi:glycopeptide antibiotics resistance protein
MVTAVSAATPKVQPSDTSSVSELAARAAESPARIGFGVWSAVIVAATVPWTDFVGHTHWQNVQWIPFRSPPVKLIDVAVNIAFYAPFGYQFARGFAPRARVLHAIVLAGALSLVLEWSQLYSHSRFPSTQDVVCNVMGAWLGAWCAATGRRRSHNVPSPRG